MNSNSHKNVAMLGGVAIAIAIVALVIPVALREISAQQPNANTTQTNPMRAPVIPQLNGSVNVLEQSNQFIQDNVRVPFATALQTAQTEVGNGTAISGNLGVAQGYLVYIFKVANFDAQTSRTVIVDAGNGAVLYTSRDMPLFFGGGLGCRVGGFGGGGGGQHMGFGNHWGNQDRGSGQTSTDINNGQPTRNPIVVSPTIGV
ncbi:MAG: hypothetical protein M3286_01120 [Thermoproteota archaeon]|nr:hypothetical protein [Thermoproteota archaeon]